DEPAAEPLLELLQPGRQGRLRHARGRGGAAEMLVLGQCREEAELLQAGQGYHRFFRSYLSEQFIGSIRHLGASLGQDKSPEEIQMLTVGDRFPDFALTAVNGTDPKTAMSQVTNQSWQGKWLVVMAWPKDFTFVCPTEIVAFNALARDFADRDAQILGLS